MEREREARDTDRIKERLWGPLRRKHGKAEKSLIA